MKYTPHAYQTKATDFVISHRYCALFLDMGLGKTVSALTAIDQLLNDYLESEKVLVIAPKSVAQNTWSSETAKWDHLRNLRLSIVMGTQKQRTDAVNRDADIYVTNRDNVVWLVKTYGNDWPFDTIVVDESSSFKSPSSQRFKALRAIRPQCRRIILLTGTPSPNGLMDLWSQIWLLDRGQRLGATLKSYRSQFFMEGRRNGHVVYEWIPMRSSRDIITKRISDICLSMQASDYLSLPPVIDGGMDVSLSDPELKAYKKFEKDQLMQLDGEDIEAVTAAALVNKLLQFTGGAVYDEEHGWHETSTAKLEALQDLIEAADSPVLVYYQYQSELERLRKALNFAVPFKGEPNILQDWNDRKIPVLLAHPASVAYGLNMQKGGHIIVWYSLTWNLELYEQANARLNRQGQEHPVIIYHLTAPGTVDERVRAAIIEKDTSQKALLRQIKEMREKLQ